MRQFAVVLSRTIPGPRGEVYRAFLDPELLPRWMCPGESVVSAATVEERVGGRHVVEMLAPDGVRHAFESVIRELVPGERIVLDFNFVRSGEPLLEEETRFTATFHDAGERATEVRIEHERIVMLPPLEPQSVDAGWNSVLDKLEALYEKRAD